MIIFKDVISGDEVLSDSFDPIEVDGVVYEADCAMVTLGAVEINTGANASAEEAEEGTEDSAQTVNNIVNSFRLQSTQYDKKQYLLHLKTYFKKVKESMKSRGKDEAEIKDFETKAAAYAKKVIANIGDYDFYTGESMDPDGMVVLLNFREDGTTPYVIVWKAGVLEEKV